ncbi:hypothetical protein [Haladaptatus sp. CMAA 1911]|uniref:hypothetical protein n=1 Tax=unclassified Haladaptatus TaxID=2622732 RepID=UPI0037548BA6
MSTTNPQQEQRYFRDYRNLEQSKDLQFSSEAAEEFEKKYEPCDQREFDDTTDRQGMPLGRDVDDMAGTATTFRLKDCDHSNPFISWKRLKKYNDEFKHRNNHRDETMYHCKKQAQMVASRMEFSKSDTESLLHLLEQFRGNLTIFVKYEQAILGAVMVIAARKGWWVERDPSKYDGSVGPTTTDTHGSEISVFTSLMRTWQIPLSNVYDAQEQFCGILAD